jgi:hypothetical protein
MGFNSDLLNRCEHRMAKSDSGSKFWVTYQGLTVRVQFLAVYLLAEWTSFLYRDSRIEKENLYTLWRSSDVLQHCNPAIKVGPFTVTRFTAEVGPVVMLCRPALQLKTSYKWTKFKSVRRDLELHGRWPIQNSLYWPRFLVQNMTYWTKQCS